jgi:protein-disulfide isomerase-like protein with CxxC motif
LGEIVQIHVQWVVRLFRGGAAGDGEETHGEMKVLAGAGDVVLEGAGGGKFHEEFADVALDAEAVEDGEPPVAAVEAVVFEEDHGEEVEVVFEVAVETGEAVQLAGGGWAGFVGDVGEVA